MNTSRSAFTLIEMLVVIALLTTLMGIGMAGMRAADAFAKETRTKTTISKLNQFVMEKYASYQYRRVPGKGTERQTRLFQLMKYEMPDHVGEVVNGRSPQRIQKASGKINSNSEIQSAELLYQIVMGMPEADSAFTSMEIADTDGNGLNEFVDGWGHPIFFIRWPAGHCNGGYVISKIQTKDTNPNGGYVNPDPFNPNTYAVYPLIYSCGPDGESGIPTTSSSTSSAPCTNSTSTVGAPGTDSSRGIKPEDYYDNITNHNL